MVIEEQEQAYAHALAKLTRKSVEGDYNVFRRFDWPDVLPAEGWWMSPELLTVQGTKYADSLGESTLQALSKWEAVNFFSLNIHGIRELIVEVTRRIHTAGYEGPSEFFHRFLGEENDHMWFFANFCLRYAAKIYPDRAVKLDADTGAADPLLDGVRVFARILIFEEIVDFYNARMGKDKRLHPLIQSINRVHHEDESRHIAGGRQVLKKLFRDLSARAAPSVLTELDEYLQRYVRTSIESLYNPSAYRDAGIPNPHKVRREVLEAPARKAHHRDALNRILGFLTKNQILSNAEFV